LKVLLSPSSFGEISPKPKQLLASAGYAIVENPYGRKLTELEVVELAKDCVGIIAGLEPLSSIVIDKLPNLKCISRVGVGMDNVDIEYANSKQIKVLNTPNGPTRAVAELTMGMVFSLLRRIPQADSNMKKNVWKKETGNLLYDKTVGIIGLGRIGKMVAEMFIALGNPVIGFDISSDNKWAEKFNIELCDLQKVLERSDIITLHVPGSTDKKPIIGKSELEFCKNSTIIINITRGGVIDEIALYDALIRGNIKGAAIDVFEEEPYKGPLITLDNVILTPHIGSYASEGKLQMEIDSVENLINALKV
jgi:D-3-phosphoglycerate dehydrogenase